MHEMSLAESVLQIIEESARAQNFRRVRTVTLEIGALSAVEPDAMRFCFEAMTGGSIAEGARLEIIATEGRGWCPACGRTVAIRQRHDSCPSCGGYQVQAVGGMEMKVRELEVE